MVKPRDFSITIMPDGKIVLELDGQKETDYRRILEFLQETVGPVQALELAPADPPERRLRPALTEEEQEAEKIRLGKRPEQ